MTSNPDAGLEAESDLEDAVKFGKSRLRWREYLVSFVVTAAVCAFIYARMDVSAFTDGLGKANYLLLIPATVIISFAWFLRAVRWHVLLRPFHDMPMWEGWRVLMVSSAIGAVVPARAGELWRAHAMGRHTGLSRSTVLGTIVVERLIDGSVLVVLAMISIVAIGPSSSIAILIIAMGGAFVLGTIFFMVMTHSPRLQDWVTGLLLKLAPAKLKPAVADKMSLFMHGVSSLRSNSVLLSASGLTVVIYLLDAFTYWMMGRSFGLHVSADAYLLVVVVSNLAVAIPISIGGIGPYEFFVQQALVLQDAHSELALALALFMHVLTLLVPALWGVLGMWKGAAPVRLSRTTPIETPLVRKSTST